MPEKTKLSSFLGRSPSGQGEGVGHVDGDGDGHEGGDGHGVGVGGDVGHGVGVGSEVGHGVGVGGVSDSALKLYPYKVVVSFTRKKITQHQY